MLAEAFLDEIGRNIGPSPAGLSKDARDRLLAHRWPGNTPAAATLPAGPIPPEGLSLDAVERDLTQKAMAQAHNNKSEAARLLGLARGQLYSLLKRHGLDPAGL